ncbi:MAG TPA: hypothetical protein VMP03_15800 [Methylomirabilota bacterium]|nr:hypothetical protein [Methylomirabilota bacterium]
MGIRKRNFALAVALIAAAAIGVQESLAANTPCSGKKGGVSHCHNGKFICKDGTMSQSKKTCRASDADD